MAFRTFLGPLLLGTQKWGVGAAGTGRNTGVVECSQTYDSGDLTGTVVSNVDGQRFTLPQGALITDIVVDQVVVAGTGTTTWSVGTASGGAQLMAAVDASAGGRFRGTATAATQLAWTTATASADAAIYVRLAVATGTLTTGRALVTIRYQMRNPDGGQFPTTFIA